MTKKIRKKRKMMRFLSFAFLFFLIFTLVFLLIACFSEQWREKLFCHDESPGIWLFNLYTSLILAWFLTFYERGQKYPPVSPRMYR